MPSTAACEVLLPAVSAWEIAIKHVGRMLIAQAMVLDVDNR